ncbi:hypothetical protein PG996_007563 [Apiospora saccharicola]|uniref:Peptidase A1 domain-containing protein n=1 Tax=Apiospora saccharicola TaxID=335842 RepID=A0ABR1VDP5_9PEZI
MRPSLVATILFAATHARQRAQPQLHTPDEKEPPSTQDPRVARANTAGGTTTNELNLRLAGPNVTYTAEFGIGTPPQRFELIISSSTLSALPLHDGSLPPCDSDGCPHETYDSNASNTSEGKENYNVQDGNGKPNGAYGQFFTDTWQVGNAKVGNVSFAATANDAKGQWAAGLGGIMDSQESSRHSLTSAFAVAGLSTTSAYGVWLGDLAGKVGSIVFGGIDTQKFKGTLTRLKTYPLQLDQKKDDRLGVQLSAVLAVSVMGTDVLAFGTQPLLLEFLMGTSGITLPGDLVKDIYKEVGATTDPEREGMAIIPCHMGNSPAYFSFVFSSSAAAGDGPTGAASPPRGPTVNVFMASLAMPYHLDAQSVSGDMFNDPANPTCTFAIIQGTDSFGLGEAFMRSTSEGFQHWETARPPPATNGTGTDDDDDDDDDAQSSSKGLTIGLGAGLPCGAVAVLTGFMAYWRIKLKRPLPILKHFSKRRWINPYATELEVKHPQPDAAEVVGFPWAFDRPVGWTGLNAPVHLVELGGDYFYHQPHSSYNPRRQDTPSSSTAVDTEEARSAIARRESMIIPGGVSAMTSPMDGGGLTARDSDSYMARATISPLRMSFIPGPDRIDIGVLADHPENLKDGIPKFPEERKSNNGVAADHGNEAFSQQGVGHEARTVDDREDIARRTPSYTTRPSGNSPRPLTTPTSPGPKWL